MRGDCYELDGRSAGRLGLHLPAACQHKPGTPMRRAWLLGYFATAGATPLKLPARPVNWIGSDGKVKDGGGVLATRDGEDWTAAEDALLIRLWGLGFNPLDMVADLKRSAGSISARAMRLRKLGHSLPCRPRGRKRGASRFNPGFDGPATDPRPERKFAAEDDARLLAMRGKNIPDWSIAEKLAFPVWRVRARAQLLLDRQARNQRRPQSAPSGNKWPDADEKAAWRMARIEKLTAPQIGAALGRSPKAVRIKLYRMRDAAQRAFEAAGTAGAVAMGKPGANCLREPRVQTKWTDARDAELARRWNIEKQGEAEIARALKTTRGAIMGRKRELKARGIYLEERRGKQTVVLKADHVDGRPSNPVAVIGRERRAA